MTDEKRISALERLAHAESKWPGTEDTLEALDEAISALRDRIAREKPEALTCEGCIFYPDDEYEFVPCDGCRRLVRTNDFYRTKPKEGTR